MSKTYYKNTVKQIILEKHAMEEYKIKFSSIRYYT